MSRNEAIAGYILSCIFWFTLGTLLGMMLW